MPDPSLDQYPRTLPDIQLSPTDSDTAAVVDCPELQWWFVAPRPGDVSSAVWYDRDTGDLSQIRETAQPLAENASGDGNVRIDIDEWARDPRDSEFFTYDRITMVAALTPDRAVFKSVAKRDTSTQLGDPEFESQWTGGTRRIVDDGRFQQIGQNCYQTTQASGMGVGLVNLTIGVRHFQCLRVFDLPSTDGSDEIGQPLIDLDTGRTLAYWQYRPVAWDSDAADWIARHPGDAIMINNVLYQRRNCTGRDEIALTQFALGTE